MDGARGRIYTELTGRSPSISPPKTPDLSRNGSLDSSSFDKAPATPTKLITPRSPAETDPLERISEGIRTGQIANPDAYLEELAHQTAYRALSVGSVIPARTPFNHYTVTQVFKNDAGLVAFGLESNGTEPPILLFQGTDPQHTAQLHLNLDPDIGAEAIKPSLEELSGWLRAHPGTILTGHSLGGAKAQQLAARLPEGVGGVVTFCSPGIGKETAKGFRKYAAVTPDPFGKRQTKPISVRHYITEGDPVPWFGDTLIDGVLSRINPDRVQNPIDAHGISALLANRDARRITRTIVDSSETSPGFLERQSQKEIVQTTVRKKALGERPKTATST